ncbi:hypothetical protein LTR16_003146 [Cryomyces antarcticus]|uniref:Uncharacterized protein n=1 Tax=Cryomyces antarcticus TaxID=329879 RepID=A0ABR0LP32_9PEZI|nr:hypothetical protein LTR60_002998 [Cryomyces antarcticus]KAK5201301.1 hypothetical protein LTR16_003146 [Cryomyces antarcticus]
MGLLKKLCHGLQENLGIGKRGREYHYGANDQAPDCYCHGTSRYQHPDCLCAGGPRGIPFPGLRLKDMGVILTKGYDKADEEARKKAPPSEHSDKDRRGNAHSQKWEQVVKDAGPASWTDDSYRDSDTNSDSRKDGSSHSSDGAREPRGKQGHLFRRGEIDYDDGRPGARGPGAQGHLHRRGESDGSSNTSNTAHEPGTNGRLHRRGKDSYDDEGSDVQGPSAQGWPRGGRDYDRRGDARRGTDNDDVVCNQYPAARVPVAHSRRGSWQEDEGSGDGRGYRDYAWHN